MFIKCFVQNSKIKFNCQKFKECWGCGPGKQKWHEKYMICWYVKEQLLTVIILLEDERVVLAAPSWKKMTTFTLIMILQFEDESNEELLKSVNQTKI